MTTRTFVRTAFAPNEPPPLEADSTASRFARSLFATPANFALTVLSVGIVALVLPPLIRFLFLDATWSGTSRDDCLANAGACWPFVRAKFGQFIYGFYPAAERWRPNLVLAFGALLLAPLLIPAAPFKRTNALLFFGVYPVVSFVLLTGGNLDLQKFLLGRFLQWTTVAGVGFGIGLRWAFWTDFLFSAVVIVALVAALAALLRASVFAAVTAAGMVLAGLGIILLAVDLDFGLAPVETRSWGGFLVTLIVAVTGIVVSLPLGVLLALGRRSRMPAVRYACILFIEFWRGVPLITVLFFATYMLPLFLPRDVTFDTLLRALIGVALFAAAYMAEVVRGGLQSISRGQHEAAAALGLGYWRMMGLIILPQALTLVIPGIVNNFIGLFKDTTLVLIVAIFDLLGQIRASFADPNWATPVTLYTGFAFAGVIYFVFCFGMSRYALYIERRTAAYGRGS
ncbi:MAG: amino acid ABC transporter permease [Bradyrhizobiaceae bacterium]|nr:amino acid ABC transporter permease [Bradyrhizobiaceae bacterium]